MVTIAVTSEAAIERAWAGFGEVEHNNTIKGALDIALHDAYGKLLGRDVYTTYNAEFMNVDLSHFLEPAAGSTLSVRRSARGCSTRPSGTGPRGPHGPGSHRPLRPP